MTVCGEWTTVMQKWRNTGFLARLYLNYVHGRHGKTGAVNKAANVAVKFNVVEVVLGSLDVGSVLLRNDGTKEKVQHGQGGDIQCASRPCAACTASRPAYLGDITASKNLLLAESGVVIKVQLGVEAFDIAVCHLNHGVDLHKGAVAL